MENLKNAPLYQRLMETIKEDIINQRYKVGDLLPTEESLQKQFEASRTTVRKAVEGLELEGYVKKIQGSGTRISSVHPKQDLNYLSSISETLYKMYGNVQTRNLSINKVKPGMEIQKELQISELDDIYTLQRTKVVFEKPVVFIKNFLVAEHIPNLEKYSSELAEMGLYQTLEKCYKLELGHAVENISVYMSGPLDDEIFEVSGSIPLYHSKRKTYLSDGRLFEYVTSFIRAEDFEYTVYLKGREKDRRSRW